MRIVLFLILATLTSCLGPEEQASAPDPDAPLAADIESLEFPTEEDERPPLVALEDPDTEAAADAAEPGPEIPEEAPPEPDLNLPPSVIAQKDACERRGGRFAPIAPGSSLRRCFTVPKDANNRCTTGADCEGACLARSRTCAPVVPLLGCHTVILSSGIPVEQCLE